MADTNTTTLDPAVQPTQQQELTGLERARLADTRKTETLDARQAYSELELFGTEAKAYTKGALEGEDYFMFRFRGAICTVSSEFKKAYDEGTMLGLTATPTVFEQDKPDPNNAGKVHKVVGYGWSLSYNDVAKMEKAQKAMAAAGTVNLKMQLQEIKMKKQIEAIAASDFKIVIGDKEIQEMLAAI